MNREKPRIFLFPLVFCLCATLPVQASPPLFRALGRTHLPAVENPTAWTAWGDVDGDGDVDFVTGNRDGADDILYLNDGEGHYSAAPRGMLPPLSGGPILFKDLDRDGDLDLVLRGSILYLNDGKGRFKKDTKNRIPFHSNTIAAFAFGDVDRDGDCDLVLQVEPNHSVLLLNDGKGFFSKPSWGDIRYRGYFSEVALGDVDGDGDLDLAATFFQGGLALFLNQGKSGFLRAGLQRISPRKDCKGDVAMVDLDRDGDLDILSGGGSGLSLYTNNGKGYFKEITSSSFGGPTWGLFDFVLADFDGDKDLDLMAGGYGLFYFRNNGKGIFQDRTKAAFPYPWPVWVEDLAAWDADKNGAPDVFVAAPLGNRLLLGDGTGRFIDGCRGRWPAWKHAFFRIRRAVKIFALADVDGDGDVDVMGLGDSGVYLYLNDGRGWYTEAPDLGLFQAANPALHAMALGDADGDGDPDLFLGGYQRHWLFLNDGKGGFKDATAARLPSTRGVIYSMVLGDVDGDGDLDLLEGADPGKNLFLNDGKGKFKDASASLPKLNARTHKLVLLDADGDGDLDLFAANYYPACTLYSNNGKGRFTDVTSTSLPKVNGLGWDALAADLDGDGDQDLVLTREHRNAYMLVNDGKGIFSASLLTGFTSGAFVAAGDLDGDGLLDLVGAPSGWNVTFFMNQGGGSFKPLSFGGYGGWEHYVTGLALGDLDADGDTDLLLGTAGLRQLVDSRVFFNVSRQVLFPWIPSPGRLFKMDFFARPSRANGRALVIPFLSAGEKRTPLPPLGTFGLDPARMAILPPLYVSGPAGKKEILLRIPPDPSLVGGRFYVQGLTAADPGGPLRAWRFTSVEKGVFWN